MCGVQKLVYCIVLHEYRCWSDSYPVVTFYLHLGETSGNYVMQCTKESGGNLARV